jgi:hypothetical protein
MQRRIEDKRLAADPGGNEHLEAPPAFSSMGSDDADLGGCRAVDVVFL